MILLRRCAREWVGAPPKLQALVKRYIFRTRERPHNDIRDGPKLTPIWKVALGDALLYGEQQPSSRAHLPVCGAGLILPETSKNARARASRLHGYGHREALGFVARICNQLPVLTSGNSDSPQRLE